MVIQQYEIILVNLDPTIGSEMKKTRPSIVISPDEMNRNINTIVIAPMTSSCKNYPTRIPIEFKQKKGWICIDQIRTIDKKRAIKVLGKLTPKIIKQIKNIIKEAYVD